jgi:hypothetical protein
MRASLHNAPRCGVVILSAASLVLGAAAFAQHSVTERDELIGPMGTDPPTPGADFYAGPVIDIPPQTLPDEAYFATYPRTVVNVHAMGAIGPFGHGDPFEFNHATINILEMGFFQGYPAGDCEMRDVTINVFDGAVIDDQICVHGNSDVTVHGGVIGDWFLVDDDGHLAIHGGVFQNNVMVAGCECGTEITGGLIPTLFVYEDSAAEITGGWIQLAKPMLGGSLLLRGGRVDEVEAWAADVVLSADVHARWMHIENASSLTFSGTEFRLDGYLIGVPVGSPVTLPDRDGALLEVTLVDGSTVAFELWGPRPAIPGIVVIDGTSQVLLQNVSRPPMGDLNQDGLTNVRDVQILIGNLGAIKPPGEPGERDLGDLDGDGLVTIDDLQILLTRVEFTP